MIIVMGKAAGWRLVLLIMIVVIVIAVVEDGLELERLLDRELLQLLGLEPRMLLLINKPTMQKVLLGIGLILLLINDLVLLFGAPGEQLVLVQYAIGGLMSRAAIRGFIVMEETSGARILLLRLHIQVGERATFLICLSLPVGPEVAREGRNLLLLLLMMSGAIGLADQQVVGFIVSRELVAAVLHL